MIIDEVKKCECEGKFILKERIIGNGKKKDEWEIDEDECEINKKRREEIEKCEEEICS